MFASRIPALARGVSEIYGHLVEDGPEPRGYDPAFPDVHAHDAGVFTDPAIKAMIATNGVTPISYRPLSVAKGWRRITWSAGFQPAIL